MLVFLNLLISNVHDTIAFFVAKPRRDKCILSVPQHFEATPLGAFERCRFTALDTRRC